MVSKVSETVNNVEAPIAEPVNSKDVASRSSSLEGHESNSSEPLKTWSIETNSKPTNNTGPVLGIIVAGILILFVVASIVVSQNPKDYASNQATKEVPTSPALAPSEASPEPPSAPSIATSPSPAPSLSAAAPSRDASDNATEEPPVGQDNKLNISQLRYCEAEKIRLDAINLVLDNRQEDQVNLYNTFVNDYNSRCGQFKYKGDELRTAQQQVEFCKGDDIRQSES